jgi:hypothetical protein
MEAGQQGTDYFVEHTSDVFEGHGVKGLAELRVQRISSDANAQWDTAEWCVRYQSLQSHGGEKASQEHLES